MGRVTNARRFESKREDEELLRAAGLFQSAGMLGGEPLWKFPSGEHLIQTEALLRVRREAAEPKRNE